MHPYLVSAVTNSAYPRILWDQVSEDPSHLHNKEKMDKSYTAQPSTLNPKVLTSLTKNAFFMWYRGMIHLWPVQHMESVNAIILWSFRNSENASILMTAVWTWQNWSVSDWRFLPVEPEMVKVNQLSFSWMEWRNLGVFIHQTWCKTVFSRVVLLKTYRDYCWYWITCKLVTLPKQQLPQCFLKLWQCITHSASTASGAKHAMCRQWQKHDVKDAQPCTSPIWLQFHPQLQLWDPPAVPGSSGWHSEKQQEW